MLNFVFNLQGQPGSQPVGAAAPGIPGAPQAPAGTYQQQPYGAYQPPGGALL